MFNRAIEIHDSVLESFATSQGVAELRFSRVYIHQTQGEPGRDAGTVWTQKAVLRIFGASVKGAFSGFPVDLDHGEIILAKSRMDNLIPIPIRYEGEVKLRLEAWGNLKRLSLLLEMAPSCSWLEKRNT